MSATKQKDQLRPRLPWLSRIGTKNGELTQLGAIVRGAAAVLAIVNPIATIVLWVCLLALSRTRVKGWWLSLGGGAVTVVALLLGWVARYNTVWRDLMQAARQAVEQRDLQVWQDAFSDWPTWLAWQIPVGISLGVCLAGFVLSYRARYYAVWRPQETVVSARAVAKGMKVLDLAADRRAAVTRADDVVIPLGVDLDTAQPFELYGSALRMHSVVAGPTGFGKSTTVQRIVHGLVAAPAARPAGIGALLVDMKGDPDMVGYLRGVATTAGRRFHLLTTRSGRYNPLRHGDAAELKDRLIETEANSADGGFSEPHYRRLGERYVLLTMTVLLDLVAKNVTDTFDGQRRSWRRDLSDLVELMRPGGLAKQVDRLSPSVASEVKKYLTEMEANKNLVQDTYGVFTRFALIVEGPAGAILTDDGSDDVLDVEAAIRAGDVVCASLSASTDSATSRVLGNLLLQDVTATLGRLETEGFGTTAGRMVWVGVDEFSALGGELLTNLYARGRSAGAAVALASQDLDGDLGGVSPEFKTQVLTNANVVILHQQRGESPDTWASAIGTREVWKETLQVTSDVGVLGPQDAASGVGSLRQAHEFLVAPDTLRNLGRGEAIVIVGHPDKRATRVLIARPPAAQQTEVGQALTPAGVETLTPSVTPGRAELALVSQTPTGPENPWAAAVNPWAVAAAACLPSHEQTSGEDTNDEMDAEDAPVVEPVD